MILDEKDKSVRLAQALIIIFLFLSCVAIILPVFLTLIVSLSSELSVIKKGYSFFPLEWSIEAYKEVFSDNDIFKAYGVTIFITVAGTSLSIMINAMCAFPMAIKRVKWRNKIAMYFYLPTVISGGIVAWYFNIAYTLHLKNSIFVLFVPGLVGVYNIFMLRNYFKSIPESFRESAEIDGAKPYTTLFKIYMPLSVPILATISLYTALGFWNEWSMAMWFIDYNHRYFYPLQYYLQMIATKLNSQDLSQRQGIKETIYMATMFVTMGPIVLVYPFVQKYFIKGIFVGGIKG